MEEKDSEISGPCEEFRIYFCGEVPSGSVVWYRIDVSEKKENSTKELNPFSVTKHFPSVYCAILKGCIYSLGGQESGRTGGQRSGRTLLNDVSILDINSLDSFAARGEEKLKRPKPEEPEMPQKRPKLKGPEFGKPEDPEPDVLFGIGYLQQPLEPGLDELFGSEYLPPSPVELRAHELRGLHWIDGPRMTFARCNPHTMVVDQKLYVLSGFEPNQNQPNGWIEVFDPEDKKWESLPSPPEQIHSSVMISGLLKAKKEIIIAKQRWDRHPMTFYSYNIKTGRWNTLLPHRSEASVHLSCEASVHLPPNAGRAVTVGNTLYWISTEEHNHECIIRAYDLDTEMWFEDHLNAATIFGRREHFSSIYSSRPGFLHLHDRKFCLLLQSSITKDDPESFIEYDPVSSIEYLYCVILDISPIYEYENRGKFELTTVSVQKYSMDRYINFLDCMLGDRVSGVKSVDRRGQSTSADFSREEIEEFRYGPFEENDLSMIMGGRL